jgi:hypothetical protein
VHRRLERPDRDACIDRDDLVFVGEKRIEIKLANLGNVRGQLRDLGGNRLFQLIILI